MPATHLTKKYSEPKAPDYDPLKGMILERVAVMKIKPEILSAIFDCSEATARKRMKQPTREWKYGEILDFCKYAGIPLEELRTSVRYIK